MNRTVNKWTVDSAKYFKEVALGIMPDIPCEELSKIWPGSISLTSKRLSPRTKRMM